MSAFRGLTGGHQRLIRRNADICAWPHVDPLPPPPGSKGGLSLDEHAALSAGAERERVKRAEVDLQLREPVVLAASDWLCHPGI